MIFPKGKFRLITGCLLVNSVYLLIGGVISNQSNCLMSLIPGISSLTTHNIYGFLLISHAFLELFLRHDPKGFDAYVSLDFF